jgi:hypothetical protein
VSCVLCQLLKSKEILLAFSHPISIQTSRKSSDRLDEGSRTLTGAAFQ